MGATTSTSYAGLPEFLRCGLPRDAIPDVSDDEILAQLERSSRFIDSALERFSPPLTTWGSDLVEATCVHAAWTLAQAKGRQHPAYGDPALAERFATIVYDPKGLAWLQRVAKGEFTPFGVVDQTPDTPEMSPVGWSDGERGWITPGGSL